MKKTNTLIAILVIIFAITGLKAQTYPVPKYNFHVHGGYTYCLPDLKGDYPADLNSGKNPPPYFIKNGFNVGVDGKYYIDKKSTFGIMLSLTYSLLRSGNIAVADPIYGTGTFNTDMNIFTIGAGVEYDFAPKRPANPFVNAQFTTNIFSGNTEFAATSGEVVSSKRSLTAATRFGAMFGAGVDVKLSKNIGIVLGGRYAFANLFGKQTGSTSGTSTTAYDLDDQEITVGTVHKSRKIAYLQFFAGASFYFGLQQRVKTK